jgi:hypothetical protein
MAKCWVVKRDVVLCWSSEHSSTLSGLLDMAQYYGVKKAQMSRCSGIDMAQCWVTAVAASQS